MENSKAYTLLRLFTKKELTSFRNFITSPYFNKSHNVVKLFDKIRKHHPAYNSRKLEPEILHKEIYRNNNKGTKSINNLFTNLTNLTEKYLAYEIFQNDEAALNKYLLLQLDKRGHEKYFLNKLEKSFQKIFSLMKSDTNHFQNLLTLNIIDANHAFASIFPGSSRTFSQKYSGVIESIIISFYILALRALCKFTVTKYWVNYDKELISRLNALRQLVKNVPDFINIPTVTVYKEFTKCFNEEDKPEFSALKSTVYYHEVDICKNDFGIMLLALFYYIDYQNTINQYKYDQELIELTGKLLELNPWQGFGGIHEHLFTSIVSAGIRTGNNKWTENFISNNINKVIKTRQKDTLNINYAIMNFQMGQFKKKEKEEYFERSLEYLAHYKPHDYYGKLLTFNLSIKLFYETGNNEQIISICDSYEHYLKDNLMTIPIHFFNSNWFFCKSAAKIVRHKYNCDSSILINLLIEVKKADFCTDKIWLEEKLITIVPK